MSELLGVETNSATVPYDPTDISTDIAEQDIKDLMVHFEKNEYDAPSESVESAAIMRCSLELLKKDYNYVLLNNTTGNVCPTYPSHLPVITDEITVPPNENSYTAEELYPLFLKSKDARCRSRTVMPVIFYKNKYVCRSATLSCGCEMFVKRGFNYLYRLFGVESPEEAVCKGTCCDSDISESEFSFPSVDDEVPENEEGQMESFFTCHNTVRGADIKVLKKFKVKGIVDLMVEKKKCKYGMKISSSEKVDSENRYLQFQIIGLPYPGCEHFSQFLENSFEARNLNFSWDPYVCDANLVLPSTPHIDTNLRNEDFREWDTVTLTQSYLKYILNYLDTSEDSILVHCISGWDRTPLFISMIRLSLWADGLIHQSLDEYQMLYFCIAFDWFLFSHQLKTRIGRKEEIFYFCFYMLKFLEDDDYSLVPRARVSSSEDESNGNPPSPLDTNKKGKKNGQTTAPMNVPSASSNSDWQVVTETGSYSSQDLNLNSHVNISPVKETSRPGTGLRQHVSERSLRLRKVRELFYKTYHSTIGLTTVGYTQQPFFSTIVKRLTGIVN